MKVRSQKATPPKTHNPWESERRGNRARGPISQSLSWLLSNQLQPFCLLPLTTTARPLSILALYYPSLTFASMILFPPIVRTFSIKVPPESSASTSSPPPILFPLISTFGTVRRPVLFSSDACSLGPSGCWSSSTTKGAGIMEYFSSRIRFALAEKGQ